MILKAEIGARVPCDHRSVRGLFERALQQQPLRHAEKPWIYRTRSRSVFQCARKKEDVDPTLAFERSELSNEEERQAEEMVQEDFYAQIPEEKIGRIAGQDELHCHRQELDVDKANRLIPGNGRVSSVRGPVEQRVEEVGRTVLGSTRRRQAIAWKVKAML
jgi:hypothetical protein